MSTPVNSPAIIVRESSTVYFGLKIVVAVCFLIFLATHLKTGDIYFENPAIGKWGIGIFIVLYVLLSILHLKAKSEVILKIDSEGIFRKPSFKKEIAAGWNEISAVTIVTAYGNDEGRVYAYPLICFRNVPSEISFARHLFPDYEAAVKVIQHYCELHRISFLDLYHPEDNLQ